MNRYRQSKNNFYFIIVMLFILGIGIGYAVLSERLTIDNTISYASMKWDVGFASVEDAGGTIESTGSISNDGKSINVSCNLGLSTSRESCVVKATIVNNGTFDVALTEDPIITYDDTYIHTLTLKWNDHPTYENYTVLKDNFVRKGESEEVILTIKTKNLKADMLPTQALSIPITVTLNFEQWQGGELPETEDLAVLKTSGVYTQTEFWKPTISSALKNVFIERGVDAPNDVVQRWDISHNGNNSVVAYLVFNSNDPNYYDLHIQSDTQLYANKNMYQWFYDLKNLESIVGLENLNTSQLENAGGMFARVGLNNSNFNMDVTSLDTSSVTNMDGMFFFVGMSSTMLHLDVSGFDTSNVTNMATMFQSTGYYTKNFTLDVSNFDTSKVTNMSYMFSYSGYSSELLELDVSNFDTSSVTDMGHMFEAVGFNNLNFSLDVSGFDTSKVTNMSNMFNWTAYFSTNFTLDVSGFDTSQVINMVYMFSNVAFNSTNFKTSITIMNPNVESYVNMFSGVATKEDSKITVNYTSETSDLVDRMITTKSTNSNVVKGVQVD